MRKYHVGANVWGLSADILGFTQLKLGSDHDPLERIKDSISNGQMASFKFDQLLINVKLRTAGKGLLYFFHDLLRLPSPSHVISHGIVQSMDPQPSVLVGGVRGSGAA